MKGKRSFLIAASLALVVAFGIWFAISVSKSLTVSELPERTRKTVKPSDIVGTWQYQAWPLSRFITIEFRSNGEFVQVIPQFTEDGSIQHKGTWRLEGAHLVLEDILIGLEEEEPTKANVKWWIAEIMMRGDPDAFVVFGGDSLDERFWAFFVPLLPEQGVGDE